MLRLVTLAALIATAAAVQLTTSSVRKGENFQLPAVEDAVAAADAAQAAANQMHDEAAQAAQAQADALNEAATRADEAATAAIQLREQAILQADDQATAAGAQADQLRAQLETAEQAKVAAEEMKAAAEGTKTQAEVEGPAAASTVGVPEGTVVAAEVAPQAPVGAFDLSDVADAVEDILPTYDMSAETAPWVAPADIAVGDMPAYNTTEATTDGSSVATTKALQVTDEDCSQVTGDYSNVRGEGMTIFQTGCFLTVKTSQGGKLAKGRIVGSDLQVEGVAMNASVSELGNIFFNDGMRWMKLAQAAEGKANSVIVNASGIEAPPHPTEAPFQAEVPEAEVPADAADAVDDVVSAEAAAEESVHTGDLPEDAKEVPQTVQTSQSSGVVPAAPGGVTPAEPEAYWPGAEPRPEDASTEQAIPPVIDSSASDAPAPDLSASSNVVAATSAYDSAVVAPLAPVKKEVECAKVYGHYLNPKGQLISLKQNGCKLNVLMKDSEGKEVIRKGHVNGHFVNVTGMKKQAIVQIGKDLQFESNGVWTRVALEELKNIKKDGCEDLSGYYSASEGSLVSLDQVGCHVQLTFVDVANKNQSAKVGVINGPDMTIGNFAKTVSLSDDGGLSFSGDGHFGLNDDDNLLYGKLSEGELEATEQASCPVVSGNYRDTKGDVAAVGQSGCAVKVQMYWDETAGDITVGGYVFGDVMHLQNFAALSVVNTSDGNLIFTDGTNWTKLSANESIDLGIPEDGCVKVDGQYTDEQGKAVVVKQTKCDVEVTFWLDSMSDMVTQHGYMSFNTMHVNSFTEKGMLVDGHVRFANATWKKADGASAADEEASTAVSTAEELGTSFDEDSIQLDQN